MVGTGRCLLMTIFGGTLLACGGGDATTTFGTEGSACYPNGTCDPTLTCLSTLCVRVILDGGTETRDAGEVGKPNAGDGATVEGAPPEPIFTPAAHPAQPQVGTLGGPVLAKPRVQPIVYASDTAASDIAAFLLELTHTSYWSEATTEYGVGPLAVLPTITLATTAPAATTDAALRLELATNTSGVNPVWGAADPNVVYLFVIPDGATVNDGRSTCCDDFGGYHSEVASGSVTVPYAVGCACPGFLGFTFTGLQVRTSAISHELVETATDPFPSSNPAYQLEDRADIIWSIVTGGEVADMCAFNDDAYYVPTGAKYMVQRSWSNAAAKMDRNPCVPHTTGAAYFNSFPALDSIGYPDNSYITRGVHIPLGEKKTIAVNLFSSGATKGTWAVTAYDYDSWVLGGQPNLGLLLDKSEGRNGDSMQLTITSKTTDKYIGGGAFILVSHYGNVRDPDYQTSLTMGLVTNEP